MSLQQRITGDPDKLERSIKYGKIGILGSLVLIAFNLGTALLLYPSVTNAVFIGVGLLGVLLFGWRALAAKRKLDS